MDPQANGEAREWRAVQTRDGSWTVEHPGHGQACHSADGAWTESRERYARACRLSSRVRPGSSLRLLDIGTGIGLNLAAALEAVEGNGGSLFVVGLESERAVLERSLELGDGGVEWIRAARVAIRRSLAVSGATCVPLGERSELRLFIDDARTAIDRVGDAPGFDAIFLDPFSPGVDGTLWDPGFLSKLARRMVAGSWLSTYTSSLKVRVALARAGLRVGAGPRVGSKASGTLASPSETPPALDSRTVRKLSRKLASIEPREGARRGLESGWTPRDERKRPT